jgi:hypothetical protein
VHLGASCAVKYPSAPLNLHPHLTLPLHPELPTTHTLTLTPHMFLAGMVACKSRRKTRMSSRWHCQLLSRPWEVGWRPAPGSLPQWRLHERIMQAGDRSAMHRVGWERIKMHIALPWRQWCRMFSQQWQELLSATSHRFSAGRQGLVITWPPRQVSEAEGIESKDLTDPGLIARLDRYRRTSDSC